MSRGVQSNSQVRFEMDGKECWLEVPFEMTVVGCNRESTVHEVCQPGCFGWRRGAWHIEKFAASCT